MPFGNKVERCINIVAGVYGAKRLACVAYMSKTELETLPELEQKMNLAKRQLFVLFDFATLSPQELRLNSSTFSWSGHIFEVVHESKQMIDSKMRQFQESLRFRIQRLVEDLESFAQQVIPLLTRWLYCVKYLQYSIRLEALGYLCTSCLLFAFDDALCHVTQ